MRSRKWLGFLDLAPAALVVAGLGWVILSCADFHRGPAPIDGGGGQDAASTLVKDLMFEAQVYPVLLMRCADCHAAGGDAKTSRLVLTGNGRLDRAMVVALVTPGDPASSELLIRAGGGDAHPGDVRLPPDSPEYATVSDWIAMLPTAP
jgi:hypothetical protein